MENDKEFIKSLRYWLHKTGIRVTDWYQGYEDMERLLYHKHGSMKIDYDVNRKKPVFWFTSLYVNEAYRKRHLAHNLILTALMLCQVGNPFADVRIWVTDRKVMDFWTKMHFVPTRQYGENSRTQVWRYQWSLERAAQSLLFFGDGNEENAFDGFHAEISKTVGK